MPVIQPREPFDVLVYTQAPYGPSRQSLSSSTSHLSPKATASLGQLGLIMQHTSAWLSKVLVTPTHKEARITAFLSTWAYERYWMGDALIALAGTRSTPEPVNRSSGALVAAVMANIHGRALIGLQAAQRLIDCWILQAILLELIDHLPSNSAIDIERIISFLERQTTFFFEIAKQELADSAATRKLVLRHIRSQSWPIGANREQAKNFSNLLPDEAKALLLGQVRALPGLNQVELRGLKLTQQPT